uniref:Ig-like domain-containing protein n=1 Tax=Oryzias latipes TaxID=8090 RepID=A0A3P9K7N3_ORYLA
LGFRLGRPFLPITPLQVLLSLPTWTLKSPSRTMEVGDDVLLPCRTTSSSSSCSDVKWLYQKDPDEGFRAEVHDGNVVQSSARASQLRVSSDCYLLIRNITVKDAGRYLCRLGNKNEFDTYLHILSSEYSDVRIGIYIYVCVCVCLCLCILFTLICFSNQVKINHSKFNIYICIDIHFV